MNKHEELALAIKQIPMFRRYKEDAEARRDEAIKEIAIESERAEQAEARARELIKELGLANVSEGVAEGKRFV